MQSEKQGGCDWQKPTALPCGGTMPALCYVSVENGKHDGRKRKYG